MAPLHFIAGESRGLQPLLGEYITEITPGAKSGHTLSVGFIGGQGCTFVIKQCYLHAAFRLACEDVGDKDVGCVVGILDGHAQVAQEYGFVDLTFFGQILQYVGFNGGVYVFRGER
ncbi:MAG: hypothetical protein BWY72_00631 [Bacteroidetes bacterium ADurb.Bin416]|nr:MAG: hypothetical protein BWY72_00631 [Bacteroidetes bacterium ADurb.Bin416]